MNGTDFDTIGKRAIAKGDVISGLLLAVLGVYIVNRASQWEFLDTSGPGPGFFPTCYGIGMIVASLVLVFKSVRRPTSDGERIQWPGVINALSSWAVFALAIPVMNYLGFGIALAAIIFYFLKFVFPRTTRFALIAAVLAPIGFQIVFPLLLQVQLPVGEWTGF